MTVKQRIARLGIVGVAVGSLTACANLTGWIAVGTTPPPRTTGYTESINADGLTAFLIGGNWHSRTGAVHNTTGTVKVVQARNVVKPAATADCLWTDTSCNGVATGKLQGVVFATTTDTNGDGYVSGASDFHPAGAGQNCGMVSGATASGAFPASAMFQDTTVCAYNDMNFATAESDASYDQNWGSSASSASPGPNSLFRRMPIETIQGIMNSLDSSDVRTVYMGGAPMQVARAQVTRVSVGGKSYKPVNVFIELYNWRQTAWDMSKEPGLKLMAAWMANQMESVLDRGASSIRLEVELNHSVTLSRADLPATLVVSEPTYSTVEYLRNFATTDVRD